MGEHDAKSTDTNSGIVVGGNKKHAVLIKGAGSRRSKSKWRVWGGLVGIVIVASLAVFAYMYISDDSAKDNTQITGLSGVDRDIAEAEQVLSRAGTASKRATAYADLSSLYLNKKNDSGKAVDYARKGVDEDRTVQSYSQLALALEAAGDYSAAADAYGKAAQLSKQAGEVDDGRSGYSHYTKKQKEMEAL